MTDLLPKSRKGFAEKKYWEDFFSKQGSRTFEWYGEYPQLCDILHKYIRFKEKLLVVGCGNSSLSADLYDAGYHDNVNVDISEVVIAQMTKKYSSDRPGLAFTKMDIKKMTYGDGEFNVVLDKGTLDALMPDGTNATLHKANSVFCEIGRILRAGGRYICISLLQEHILEAILNWCREQGWMVRIHRCLDAEEAARAKSQSATFPVFVVVCTKMKKMPGLATVLEYVGFDSESRAIRMKNEDELCEAVRSAQQYALLRHHLNRQKCMEEEVSVDFHSSSGNADPPRYRMFVVDRKERSPTKFSIFIVPQGRETDWIFSTKEGRKILAQNANSERLLVVHLDRNHVYDSLDRVKSELSERVMEFAPPQFDCNHKVPFLSLGDDVGSRTLLYKGHSQTTGEYIVEDVAGDGGFMFRRLIFLSNPNTIQSEARLVAPPPATKKKKKKNSVKLKVDPGYLACEHHKCMVLGTAFVTPDSLTDGKISALLVGLGGGGLTNFVQRHLSNVHLDVVEIDAEIVSIATEWFDLDPSNNDRVSLKIQDGLVFIRDAALKDKHYDVVMLDVDNKDSSCGLGVPPPEFLEPDFLVCLRKIVSPNGILILNLVCRDSTLRSAIYGRLRNVFNQIFSKKIPEEVNEVVYAWSHEVPEYSVVFPRVKPFLKHLEIEEDFADWFQTLRMGHPG